MANVVLSVYIYICVCVYVCVCVCVCVCGVCLSGERGCRLVLLEEAAVA